MKAVDFVMKWPFVYRLWMVTHSDQKFVPILAHNNLRHVRRVLDVGCGPGTNAPQFSGSDYLGIDWNERYIRHAENRFNRKFVVSDATRLQVPAEEKFDFILVNSVLHHIDINSTKRLLMHLPSLLTEDGSVHIIELVLPAGISLPWILAKADRGEYPREIGEWNSIFSEFFDEIVFEPFDVDFLGISFWNLVYFKGRAKRSSPPNTKQR